MVRIDDPTLRIQDLRRTGMPDSVIAHRLILEGWDEKDFAEHFAPTPSVLPPAPTIVSKVQPRRSWKWPIPLSTTILSLVAFAALGFAGYILQKPPIVYSISIPGIASTTPQLTYGALPELSDPDYYRSVKKNLIEQKVSFIDANLSAMSLAVYVEGELRLEIPILAKGKVGSWWETPVGIYKIQTKEKNHFSSFGAVYQPYSLAFQGNFFIHGWPYYEDGTQVSSSYSGGCIRLSTDDAKKVFDLATVGMPVLVYNIEAPRDTFNYQLKVPPVSATSYLVADVKNGRVLANKNSGIAAPIASISKLVTALVASEYINLDADLTVPSSALVYTSVPRLKAGSQVRAYDLLFLLLQESSNEAAETLASESGRNLFIKYMNEKANAINLSHTVFSDASGAKGDYSTPEDLFTLLRYINDNRRFIFGITTGEITGSAYGPVAFKNLNNFNKIKNAPSKLVGGKVGQTIEASETYAGIFSVKVGDKEREVAVIVLGSHDATEDVKKLLTFVNSLYVPGESKGVLP